MKTLHSLKPSNFYPPLTEDQKKELTTLISFTERVHGWLITRENPPRFYYNYRGTSSDIVEMRNFGGSDFWSSSYPEHVGRIPFSWDLVTLINSEEEWRLQNVANNS